MQEFFYRKKKERVIGVKKKLKYIEYMYKNISLYYVVSERSRKKERIKRKKENCLSERNFHLLDILRFLQKK